MNTTEGFIKQFSTNMDISDILEIFDETMVLYNLIGCRKNLSISKADNSTTFLLVFKKAADADCLFNAMNNTDFTVYGSRFHVIMDKMEDNQSISTVIRKVT